MLPKGLRLPSFKIRQLWTIFMSIFLENLDTSVWSVPTCLKPFHSLHLTGPRHKDIPVLDQFCAEVIYKYLYSYTKCSYRIIKDMWNKFHQTPLNIIFVLVIKVSPMFSCYNLCPSLPSVAINRWQERLSMPKKWPL